MYNRGADSSSPVIGTNVIVDLKLLTTGTNVTTPKLLTTGTNVTTVLCAQGKRLNQVQN